MNTAPPKLFGIKLTNSPLYRYRGDGVVVELSFPDHVAASGILTERLTLEELARLRPMSNRFNVWPEEDFNREHSKGS